MQTALCEVIWRNQRNGTNLRRDPPSRNKPVHLSAGPTILSHTRPFQPDATQPFTLTVNEAPGFSSANHYSFFVGVAGVELSNQPMGVACHLRIQRVASNGMLHGCQESSKRQSNTMMKFTEPAATRKFGGQRYSSRECGHPNEDGPMG